jgi:radical SAM superfamily enzyme YgiQ (UPF0313 family)
MKVLMLNPPFLPKFSRESRSPATTKGGTLYYPYYLAYATGVLEKNGFDVKLIDAVANGWDKEQTVNIVKNFSPQLIVIDTSTPSIVNDMQVADALKEALPSIYVALVGTHPSVLPEEVLKSCKADLVCIGEYDYTVLDLARAIEKSKPLYTVDGISYKDYKGIRHTKPRKLIENLDELPFVSEVYKKHLSIRDYFYASVTHPQVTILTARGCPFNCSFCNAPFKASYRARSPKNVAEEFEYIQKELPEVKEVMIEDDTFPVNKERTIKICDLLIEREIKLRWSCNARVDTDLETLRKMKEANCRLVCVGFETPTQEVLDTVHKKTNKDIQLEFMKNAKKAGLLVHGCFILGLPEDTKDTIKKTVEFAKELGPDTVQFYPIMIYPGTEAYEWAKKNNFLVTEDFSKWLTKEGLHNCVISRPDLANIELLKLCDDARKSFYLRPSYVTYKIKQMIANPSEIRRTLKSLKIFYKYLAKGSVQEDEIEEFHSS